MAVGCRGTQRCPRSCCGALKPGNINRGEKKGRAKQSAQGLSISRPPGVIQEKRTINKQGAPRGSLSKWQVSSFMERNSSLYPDIVPASCTAWQAVVAFLILHQVKLPHFQTTFAAVQVLTLKFQASLSLTQPDLTSKQAASHTLKAVWGQTKGSSEHLLGPAYLFCSYTDLTKHILQFSLHSLYSMDMPTFSLDLHNDGNAQMPEVHPLLPWVLCTGW